jgi:hypothetical protein
MQRIKTTIPELNRMRRDQIDRRFEDVIEAATPEERSQFRIKLLGFTHGEPADDEEPITNGDLDDVAIKADLLLFRDKGYKIEPFLAYYATLPSDPNAMELEGGGRRRKTRKTKRRSRKTRRSRK